MGRKWRIVKTLKTFNPLIWIYLYYFTPFKRKWFAFTNMSYLWWFSHRLSDFSLNRTDTFNVIEHIEVTNFYNELKGFMLYISVLSWYTRCLFEHEILYGSGKYLKITSYRIQYFQNSYLFDTFILTLTVNITTNYKITLVLIVLNV